MVGIPPFNQISGLVHPEHSQPRSVSTSRRFVRRFAAALALLLIASLPACGILPFGGGEEEVVEGEEGQPATVEEQLQEALDKVTGLNLELSSVKAELDAERARSSEIEAQIRAEVANESPIVSLERARLQVVRHAQANREVYTPEYQEQPLVWEVSSSEEGDEFFYITITYQPFQDFKGTPGREEFIVDKTGNIEFRQVLSVPELAPPEEEQQQGDGSG